MNKKITLLLIGVGMSVGMATATANDRQCQVARNNANYYCNVADNNELCRYWINQVRHCGPLEV